MIIIKNSKQKSPFTDKVVWIIILLFIAFSVYEYANRVRSGYRPLVCSPTVNDARYIGQGLADYYSVPSHTKLPQVLFVPATGVSRPLLILGDKENPDVTITLHGSTTGASVILQEHSGEHGITVTQGAGECSDDIINSDTHWSRDKSGAAHYVMTL